MSTEYGKRTCPSSIKALVKILIGPFIADTSHSHRSNLSSTHLFGMYDMMQIRLHKVEHDVNIFERTNRRCAAGPIARLLLLTQQNVFNTDDILMFEMSENLYLSEGSFGDDAHLHGVGNLFDGHFFLRLFVQRGADDAVSAAADRRHGLVLGAFEMRKRYLLRFVAQKPEIRFALITFVGWHFPRCVRVGWGGDSGGNLRRGRCHGHAT